MKTATKVLASTLLAALVSLPAFAEQHVVKLLNMGSDGPMVFEPGYLKVNPGDTVTFKPQDVGHDSVSVFAPEGAAGWNSQYKEITVTLDKEGVYIYKCTPHLLMAMVGVIQVGEAVNLDQAKAEAAKLKSSPPPNGFVMNKDRLDKYLAQVK